MRADVTQLDQRPIIVATFYEESNASAVLDAYLRTLELACDVEDEVFWIVDVRAADDAFVEIADQWLDIATGTSDEAVMPMHNGAFVGLTAMADYFVEVDMPFFHEVDEALPLQQMELRAPGV